MDVRSSQKGRWQISMRGTILHHMPGILHIEQDSFVHSLNNEDFLRCFQKGAIGNRLIAILAERFSHSHCTKVSVMVRRTDRVAQRFFYFNGFKVEELLLRYYKNGEDAILMECNVPENL